MIPAADLSEQISAAGREASGTGCMKFAMNGALTIGTLDGANLEMLRDLGPENMYTFGLSPEEAARLLADPSYDPRRFFHLSAPIRRVVDALAAGRFCTDDRVLFQPVVESILHRPDPFLHLADFEAYTATRVRAAGDFVQSLDWSRRAIINVARMGWFSSDRAVREYAAGIWGIQPVPTTDPPSS
jgi:starch phosphorylase